MSVDLLLFIAVICAVIGGLIRQAQTHASHPVNDGMLLGGLLGVIGLAIVIFTKPRLAPPRSDRPT